MPRPAKKNAPTPPLELDRLTQAEYRILKLLDLGFSNQEIAGRLGIEVGTARWRLHHLFEKLGVDSRGKALALARARGLV